MRSKPLIGLLPLYLKLYDDTMPELRDQFAPLLRQIAGAFDERGVDVHRAEVCRVRSEFQAAIEEFETVGVDLIVTVHLAYSPSLEAVGALAHTALPILVLDTTMDFDFGLSVDPARIMYDHGVHGVQDLASLLRRRGKPFEIVAGHVVESDVMDRASGIARGARASRLLRSMRVLRIGEAFRGMGDFAVADLLLRAALGITVDQGTVEQLKEQVACVTPEDVEAEIRCDRQRFEVDVPDDVHRRSVRVGLALRRVLEAGGYGAFSLNFLAFDSAEGLIDTVPFLEASKAMDRGLGYAGEGDVLTAALVGALNHAFGKTTFTEIFCPDWKGDALFISHMGEVNPSVAARKARLCEKDFPWTAARNPAVLTCAPAPGPAVFVNLAPGPLDTFALLVAPVEVLGDGTHPAMRDSVRGWIRPAAGVTRFLERFSQYGGTHHSALVLGHRAEAVAAFGRLAGLNVVMI